MFSALAEEIVKYIVDEHAAANNPEMRQNLADDVERRADVPNEGQLFVTASTSAAETPYRRYLMFRKQMA